MVLSLRKGTPRTFKLLNFYNMVYLYENEKSGQKSKISWVNIVNAVIQALIAALTALGVSSCANLI